MTFLAEIWYTGYSTVKFNGWTKIKALKKIKNVERNSKSKQRGPKKVQVDSIFSNVLLFLIFKSGVLIIKNLKKLKLEMDTNSLYNHYKSSAVEKPKNQLRREKFFGWRRVVPIQGIRLPGVSGSSPHPFSRSPSPFAFDLFFSFFSRPLASA